MGHHDSIHSVYDLYWKTWMYWIIFYGQSKWMNFMNDTSVYVAMCEAWKKGWISG